VHAPADVVWNLLTDSASFPRWNSTVIRIEGAIKEGERIRIHVPGTSRTFTPRVGDVVPNRGMTWSDGVVPLFRGVRTFTLDPQPNESTRFVMEESFSGIVFAAVKGMLPDFGPIFEAFASDLKREAERRDGQPRG